MKPAKLAFVDSTDLHGCPEVGQSYVLKGYQTRVNSPGHTNPGYALFGRWVYPEGTGLYTIHERKRHQEVQTPLPIRLDSEPDVFGFVVMDNASAHTTPKLADFGQRNRDRLGRIPRPTYSPHRNLLERLWRVRRGQMIKTHCYLRLAKLAQAVVQGFEIFPLSRFGSLLGIHNMPENLSN